MQFADEARGDWPKADVTDTLTVHDLLSAFNWAGWHDEVSQPAQEPNADLQAVIMNLPCNPPDFEPNRRAYREGYKDARHAAVVLLASQPAQSERQPKFTAAASYTSFGNVSKDPADGHR